MPSPPDGILDPNDFINSLKLKNPEPSREVLYLTLRNAPTLESLVRGDWIQFADTERNLHFDGSGFGPARTYKLVEKFVHYVHKKSVTTVWQHRCLLSLVDDAREAHSLDRAHGDRLARGLLFGVRGEHVQARYLATLSAEEQRNGVPPLALNVLLSWLKLSHPFVAAADLDPDQFADVCRQEQDDSDPATTAFSRLILSECASFYHWLGKEGELDAERAAEIAGQLRVEALTFRERSDRSTS